LSQLRYEDHVTIVVILLMWVMSLIFHY